MRRFSSTAVVFLPIVLLKAIFVATYSLNITGDGYNYYVNMILPRRAYLIHASGYPFVWGHILYPFRLVMDDAEAAFVLVALQHLFDLFCLVLLFVTLRKYLGRGIAVTSVYFAGLSIFYLAHVSTTLPEWFQGDLWILFLVSLVTALYGGPSAKRSLYALSVLLLLFAYLVKFNSLALVLFFLPVLLIEALRGHLGVTIKGLSLGVVLGVVVFLGYLFGYQYPTTGTYALHYDAGWVLVGRTTAFISASNGTDTKRLFALNGILPEPYNYEPHYLDLFKHVDAVPAAQRAPYRKAYDEILHKSDAELTDFIAAHQPLAPRTDFTDYELRVQYYVGLKEGNDLGRKVAYEAIRSHLSDYLMSVIARTVPITPTNWVPRYLPRLDELSRFAEFRRADKYGYVYYRVPYIAWTQQYRTQDSESWFWKPGLIVLNLLAVSMAYIATVIISCGALAALYLVLIERRTDPYLFALLYLIVFVVAFTVATNLISAFRFKELRIVYPIIAVCVGISARILVGMSARLVSPVMLKARRVTSPEGSGGAR